MRLRAAGRERVVVGSEAQVEDLGAEIDSELAGGIQITYRAQSDRLRPIRQLGGAESAHRQ
jgi:hypothetical protein